jgi:hypothetical protein
MSDLRKSLIHLAHAHPEFRDDLLPLLRKKAVTVSVTESQIKQIAKMTDRNDHVGALVFAAEKVLKDKKLVAAIEAVGELHNFYGHMPTSLGEVKHDLYKTTMARLKRQLSPEDYEAIHSVF